MTELAYLGLPAILVPYPHAVDDHQTVNAQCFEDSKAAILVQESDLDGAKLAKLVGELLGAPEMLVAMSEAMRALAVDDSAAQICEVLVGK